MGFSAQNPVAVFIIRNGSLAFFLNFFPIPRKRGSGNIKCHPAFANYVFNYEHNFSRMEGFIKNNLFCLWRRRAPVSRLFSLFLEPTRGFLTILWKAFAVNKYDATRQPLCKKTLPPPPPPSPLPSQIVNIFYEPFNYQGSGRRLWALIFRSLPT